MLTTSPRRLASLAIGAVAALAVVAALPADAVAGDKADKPANYTLQLGLLGYSPVSYFTHNEARPGSPLYRVTYNDVTYFLESDEQVQAFESDPERFVPAYGGWCAFGATKEKHFEINPEAFKIVNGQLHVFKANDQVNARDKWNAGNEAELIGKADAFWAKVHGE
ncbi:MAG: YHS domain-containing (seleno)protein [Planctomycetota bacterium]